MLPAPDIVERLPSGMEVVIARMDAPRVVVEHRLRAGAAHEDPDARGVAHLVEHVVFSAGGGGALDYVPYVEASGGTYDAWTGVDRTVYRATVRPERLAGLLEREAKRLGPRAFTDAAVAHELGVVSEERAWRIDGSVGMQRRLEQFGALLPDHPYGWSVSPPIDALATLDRARVQAYFDRWYRADRLQLVIAGPVDPKALLRTLPALYAKLPTGAPPDPFPPLVDWRRPHVVTGPLPPGLYWVGPGRGQPDHDALRWIDAMSSALDLLSYEQGALISLDGNALTDLDDLASEVRRTSREWITEERLDEAVAAATARLPLGSAEAWVDAWGNTPAVTTAEACREAWDRWIAGEEPIHVRRER